MLVLLLLLLLKDQLLRSRLNHDELVLIAEGGNGVAIAATAVRTAHGTCVGVIILLSSHGSQSVRQVKHRGESTEECCAG